jgi:hypothetical protein
LTQPVHGKGGVDYFKGGEGMLFVQNFGSVVVHRRCSNMAHLIVCLCRRNCSQIMLSEDFLRDLAYWGVFEVTGSISGGLCCLEVEVRQNL